MVAITSKNIWNYRLLSIGAFFLSLCAVAQPQTTDAVGRFCQRHAEVDNGTRNITNALAGLELRPALFSYQVSEDGSSIATNDIAIKFLDAIAVRAGFTWRNSYGIIDTPVDGDESYTYNIALYQALEKYDLMGEWYTKTIDRLADSIIYPEGFYDASFIMVANKQSLDTDNSVNLWSFTQPFTSGVWFLIAATIVVSAFTFYLIMRLEDTGLGFGDSIFISVFSFTGHFHFNPRKTASRLFSIAVCAFALLVVAIYTANLASFLIVRSTPPISFNTIEEASRLNKKICTLSGSASSAFLEKAGVRYIGTESTDNDFTDLDVGLCEVSLVSARTWDINRNSKRLNPGCKKEWIGRVVSNQEGGFSILDSSADCTSLLRDVFEYHMIQLKKDGTFDEIWGKFLATKADGQDCDLIEAEERAAEDEKSSLQLGVESLGGVFIFHTINMVGILAIAACIYFYKTNWGKYYLQRKQMDQTSLDDKYSSEEDIENKAQNEGNTEISFRPDYTYPPQPGFDIFGVNYATGAPAHPIHNIGRRKSGRGDEAKLEEKFQQHSRRMEELLDNRLEKLLERLGDTVPLTPLSKKKEKKAKSSKKSSKKSKKKNDMLVDKNDPTGQRGSTFVADSENVDDHSNLYGEVES